MKATKFGLGIEKNLNSYLKVLLNKNSFFILLSILPKSLYIVSFIVVLGVRKVKHVMEDEKLRRLVEGGVKNEE